MASKPLTLGDKLAQDLALERRKNWVVPAVFRFLKLAMMCTLCALTVSWFLTHPDVDKGFLVLPLIVLIVLWGALFRRSAPGKQHFLVANDRQGFMGDLRLDQKTAVFDGSNIYHFGHDKGLDAQPLGALADQLRTQDYRVVCFFDANIFHTLNTHGAFPKRQRHSWALLSDIFGLTSDEIYVVPSGVQADVFILECLKHLPISFAVSNDKFRDYAAQYPSVMQGNLWRKGVVISENEVRLLHHRLQTPIHLKS